MNTRPVFVAARARRAARLPLVTCAAVAVLVVFAACRSRTGAQPPQDGLGADATLPVVQLERTVCFGTCPAYAVRLFANGAVEFDGRQHVAQPGPHSATVPPDSVRALVRRMESSGHLQADRAYEENAPGCGVYRTDLPQFTLTLRSGASTVSVRVDGGCVDTPRDLAALAADIDQIAGTRTWIEGRGGDG
jgi:hypothetical protein